MWTQSGISNSAPEGWSQPLKAVLSRVRLGDHTSTVRNTAGYNPPCLSMEIEGGNNGTHLTKLPELQESIRRQRSHYFQTWWNHTQKRRLYNQPLVHIKILNNELCSLREEEKDVLAFITVCALCLYVFSVFTHVCLWLHTHVRRLKVNDRRHPYSLSTLSLSSGGLQL